MKGVILAGGRGKRLRPLTLKTNKHLLMVAGKPMIYYPLKTLKQAGIKDVLIVTGKEHSEKIFFLLGLGEKLNLKISYNFQDKALGIPHAIFLAKKFIGKDKFVAINGDNILTDSIKPFVKSFEKSKSLSQVLLFKGTLEHAKKSGVAILKGKKVIQVIEKPKNPPTQNIVIGVYMYAPDVFKVISRLKPSKRGELEIADVHNHYILEKKLSADFINGKWHDAGTIKELNQARRMASKMQKKGF